MKKFYMLLPFFSLFVACNKDSNEPEFSLTQASQIGANTLSFRADGQVFQPYGRRCFGFGGGPCIEEPLSVYYNAKRGQFQISAFLTTAKRAEHFSLNCDSLFRSGPTGTQQHSYNYNPAGLGYSADGLNYGTAVPTQTTITITRFDTVAHIVSGTFSGNLKGLLQGATTQKQAVSIAEGRFDVRYTK
jgi:hypothetical protein